MCPLPPPPPVSSREQPRWPGPLLPAPLPAPLPPPAPNNQPACWCWSRDLGLSPQVLVFLQALLASRKHRGEQEVTALLREAAELHFSGMQGLPLGSEYLEKLNPLFLVCIAKEYLLFCPKQVRGRCIFMAGRGLGYRLGQKQGPPVASHWAAPSPRQPGSPVLFRLVHAAHTSPGS